MIHLTIIGREYLLKMKKLICNKIAILYRLIMTKLWYLVAKIIIIHNRIVGLL
jgi:hypothetical protein